MSQNTKIEWTDATWNPVTGCSKVSQGCKHCYAERDWARVAAPRAKPNVYTGRPFTDVQCHPERLGQPVLWTQPKRIFVNSMSDLFHPAVPFYFIAQVFAVMSVTTRHTYQILTKRPERMLAFFKLIGDSDFNALDRISDAWPETIPWIAATEHRGGYDNCGPAWPFKNVWLGVSVEDQATADERIPLLLQAPAAIRWISAEPLLGPLDLSRALGLKPAGIDQRLIPNHYPDLNWVVVGGESGPHARPMHPDWARSLRDQCRAARVPFLFKQWGEWAPRSACYHTLTSGQAAADIDPGATRWPCIRLTYAGNNGRDIANAADGDDCYMQKVGKALAGRQLDGRTCDQYPEAA